MNYLIVMIAGSFLPALLIVRGVYRALRNTPLDADHPGSVRQRAAWWVNGRRSAVRRWLRKHGR